MSDSAWADVDRLRAILQDAHLNVLIGAGTSSALFAPLGNVEVALTEIDRHEADAKARAVARASIQALFFDTVVWPNVALTAGEAEPSVVNSYSRFGSTLNRLLLARRSTLLPKHINLFTTNIDLAIEVAFEQLGLALNDGFVGRFKPSFDPGSFGSLRQRTSPRYGHRSEVPVFDLLKLHGSVGWLWADSTDSSAPIGFDPHLSLVHEVKAALDVIRDKLVRLDDPQELDVTSLMKQAGELDRPDGLDKFVSAYEKQVIVNPEKTKFATTVLTEIYYELIRRLANELERETSALFVVGFSFRDEHLRSIVLRAARTNPTLQVFIVCFSQADIEAYKRLVPPTAVPNGNIDYLSPPGEDDRFTLEAFVAHVLDPIVVPPPSTLANDGA